MNTVSPIMQIVWCLAFPLATHLLACLCWPLTRHLFHYLPDQGYALARVTALSALGLLSWLLFALDLIPNSSVGMMLAVLLLFAIGFWVARQSASRFCDFSSLRWSYILLIELLFYASYAFWLFIRWCDPSVCHTEQPMDLMMLTALWQSPAFPPEDLWLTGYPISYYYFGYWLMHLAARLLACPPVLTYNIAQALWFALLFSGCFGLGCNLAFAFKKKRVMILVGALCSASVLLLSNPAGFLSALMKTGHYWWWSASRTVYDGSTELITEFPFFSFLLGDNHPHLLVLPLMLLFTACCLNLLLYDTHNNDAAHPLSSSSQLRSSLTPLATMSLITGMAYITNTWNVPILLFLACLTMLATSPTPAKRLLQISLYLPGTFLILLLCFLPYHLTAQSQFSGFAFFHSYHTGLKELGLMFGYFLPGLFLLILCAGSALRRENTTLSAPLKFGLLMLAAGLVCILIPEWVYLRDVFNNRMNTVFKFYYQAWFFLSIASACGLSEALHHPRLRRLIPLAVLFLLTGLYYPAKALFDITHHFTPSPSGIHALNWFEENHPEEADAIRWLSEHTEPHERIIVPAGASYQPQSVTLSLYAGFPMLLGWAGHEQQWRGAAYPAMADTRAAFLRAVYDDDTNAFPCDAPQWDNARYLIFTRKAVAIRDPAQICPDHLFQPVYSNRTIIIYEKK